MIEEHLYPSEQKKDYWGSGEWVEEPDKMLWEYKGFQCEITRNASLIDGVLTGLGHLCGYIILPKNHPWTLFDNEDIETKVNGGITYNKIIDEGIGQIGFDCAHLYDETPYTAIKGYQYLLRHAEKGSEEWFRIREALEKLEAHEKQCALWLRGRDLKKTYKNIEFVKSECEKLVDEAIDALKSTNVEKTP